MAESRINSPNTNDEPTSTALSDPIDIRYVLLELTACVGPVQKDDILGTPTGGIIELPTLYSPSRYQTDKELSDRRKEALCLGSEFISRDINSETKVFSRRLNRDVFPHLSRLLDDLLIGCLFVTTTTGFAHTVKKDQYKEILTALYKVQTMCGNILLLNGDPIPKLPIWSRNGDINQYYLDNDYEIMAICFRTEVEQFLTIYDKYYNFLTDQPKETELLGMFGSVQKEVEKESPKANKKTKINEEE
jgi:hypothetical protein